MKKQIKNYFKALLLFSFACGIFLHSSSVFAFIKQKSLFSEKTNFSLIEDHARNYVIFFKKEQDVLIPQCQISKEKHIEVLPEDIRVLFEQNSQEDDTFTPYKTTQFHDQLAGLEKCSPELSVKISQASEHFSLYPKPVQVAAAPLIPMAGALSKGVAWTASGTTALGCALASLMGWYGMHTYVSEEQRAEREQAIRQNPGWEWTRFLPTRGETLTVAGPALIGALNFIQTYAYSEILDSSIDKKVLSTVSKASGIIGALCGVSGGAVGYFSGENLKNQRTAEARIKTLNNRIDNVEEKLLNANAQIAQLSEEKQEALDSAQQAYIRSLELSANYIAKKAQVEALKSTLENVEQEKEQLQTKLKTEQEQANNLEIALKTAQEQANNLEIALKTERDKTNEQSIALQNALKKVKNLTSTLQAKQKQVDDLSVELQNAQQEVEKRTEELNNTQKQVDDLSVELQDAQRQVGHYETVLNNLE